VASNASSPVRSAEAVAPWRVPRGVRILVSCAVALHLTAVVSAPFSQDAASELGIRLRLWLRPYVEFCYLSHGYRFFNEPGPSHMVRFELEYEDGRPKTTGTFPDRNVHKPRLFYHRHFMLAEHLNQMMSAVPAEPPPDVKPDSGAYEQWRFARDANRRLSDTFVHSYAQHLCWQYDAARVTLTGLERRLPTRDDIVRRQKRLDDPEFMERPFPLGTFSRE
jgi:hypothetical protein